MTHDADRPAPPDRRSDGTASVYALLVLVMLLWAGNSIVARAVRDQIPPFTLALCRWTGATAILLPFAWPRLRADAAAIRRHWPMILLLGAIGVGSFNALLYSGLRYTTATNGLLLQAAIPPLILVADLLFFRERPTRLRVAGCLLAAAGVVVIVFRGDPRALTTLRLGAGELLILAGVIAWAAYTSLMRLRPPVHALAFLTLTFAIGAIAMLPLAWHEWATEPVRWSRFSLACVAYVAVLPSVVAYFLYNHAIARLGAATAGQMIALQPPFGALLAAMLLSEPLHGYHAVGLALVIAGVLLPLADRAPRGDR